MQVNDFLALLALSLHVNLGWVCFSLLKRDGVPLSSGISFGSFFVYGLFFLLWMGSLMSGGGYTMWAVTMLPCMVIFLLCSIALSLFVAMREA